MKRRTKSREPDALPARLEKAIEIVCADHSFHAAILARARFEADERVRVMGVTLSGGAPLFLYSESAMRRTRARQIAATLLHELGHLLLFHVVKPIDSFEHPRARRIAEEVSANSFVKGYPFPGRPILLADYGLPDGESTDVRYRKLVEMGHGDGPADDVGTLDDHDVWERQPATSALEAAVWTANVLDAWEGAEGWDRFALPLDALSVLSSLQHGGFPGTTAEALPGADSDETGRMLRSAVERLVGARCELRESRSRPSRRAPDGGGVYPGLVVRPRERHLAMILDTSGSTAPFAYEMACALAAVANWAEVIVIQCDCRVQSVERLPLATPTLRGRGWSDLRPAFEELERHRCEAVVVVTDLETRLPSMPPAIPVLFVVTPEARTPPWGKLVRLATRAVVQPRLR